MEIKLQLDTKFTHIAGNDYGYKVYSEQIKAKFNSNEQLEIIFPDFIEGVSISFVQGLIRDMTKQIGKEKVIKQVKLKSNNPLLQKRLDDNLKF